MWDLGRYWKRERVLGENSRNLNKVGTSVHNNVSVLFFNCNECTILIWDAHPRGSRLQGIWESLHVCSHFFRKSETLIKNSLKNFWTKCGHRSYLHKRKIITLNTPGPTSVNYVFLGCLSISNTNFNSTPSPCRELRCESFDKCWF